MAAALVVVVVLALALFGGDDDGGSGGGGGGGGTAAEVVIKTVTVPGNQVWTDTGIDVFEGDYYEITATGSVLHNTADPLSAVGPDGAGDNVDPILNTPGKGVYVYPPGHGGLVARFGDGAEVFGVGARSADNVDRTGRLQLGINDYNSGNVTAAVANNSGAFSVRIKITRNV
jgi:hypothetical protein